MRPRPGGQVRGRFRPGARWSRPWSSRPPSPRACSAARSVSGDREVPRRPRRVEDLHLRAATSSGTSSPTRGTSPIGLAHRPDRGDERRGARHRRRRRAGELAAVMVSKTTAIAPGVSRSSSMRAAKAVSVSASGSASGSSAARRASASRRPRALVAASKRSGSDLDRRPVVGLQEHHSEGPTVDLLEQVEQVLDSCRATSTSSRRSRRRRRRGASSGWRSACPSATAWARSFSWCGNLRSSPPQCRSKPSPRRPSDITTHSVCQPGRPAPHGEGQLGSPGLAAFQSAKSAGWRLLLGTVDLPFAAAGQHLVDRLVGEEAVVLDRADVQVDAVVGRVGAADLDQVGDDVPPSRRRSRWRGGCRWAGRRRCRAWPGTRRPRSGGRSRPRPGPPARPVR